MPEEITVSEWADRYRILDEISSNEPGRWKTRRTPYLREIMDAYNDPDVEQIVFVKPTQVGGTESILNILAYIIDQDPGSTLIVYPSEDLAESISKNRIEPMIFKCRTLRQKYNERKSKLLEKQFFGMIVAFTGTNSPGNLSSKPIKNVLLDEVDKYPKQSGKEAGPIDLARERTRTFNYNRKIFITSTPTYTDGAVMKEFNACDTRYRYHVPCPHCGVYQELRFRNIKFQKEGSVNERADGAWYECPRCHGHISDAQKNRALQDGKWRTESFGGRTNIGFHLSALYSPWMTWRDIVRDWLKSQTDHESRMNFINSVLGEPYEQVGMTADEDLVLSRQSLWTRGIVPEGTLMITGGVDMQEDCYYYTIRAWGTNRISWNLDHGRVEATNEIRDIFNRLYYDEAGQIYQVNFALFDSGYQADFVYDFCYLNNDVFLPVKGSSTEIPRRYRMSTIEKEDSVAKGMDLVICDGSYYKNMIYSRLRQEENGWHVYDGCDREYAAQISSEHKVARKNGEHTVWVWKPKTDRADNHFLDCEVYAACAADIIGAFELLAEPEMREENDG